MNSKLPIDASKQARQFGTMLIILLAFITFMPVMRHQPIHMWSVVAIMILLPISVFKTEWLWPLCQLWLKLGLMMAKVLNPIFLGILYVMVFCPIAALLRLIGKDLLSLKLDRSADSYWEDRTNTMTQPQQFKDQF